MAIGLDLSIGSSGSGGGGSIATGMLQLAAGVPLDTTLRNVADQAGTLSPLQLSTTQVGFTWAKVRGTAMSGVIDIFGTTSQDLQFWTADGGTRYGYINSNVSGIEFLASTSRYLSFGAGNSEGMRLTDTRNLVIGTTTASARLHVRGDGTNPIARFDSSVGVDAFEFRQTSSFKIGTLNNYMWMSTAGGGNPVATGEMMEFYSDATNQSNPNFKFRSYNNRTNTAGTASILQIGSTTFGAAAGSANFIPLNIQYTINNSGAQTGIATGIFLNATETALNGMVHNLMDLQKGGTSLFRVGANNILTLAGAYQITWSTYNSYIYHGGTGFDIFTGTGSILLSPNNSIVAIVGRTNAFPAIKRNGAAIDLRLADDSGYADLNVKYLSTNVGSGVISFSINGGANGTYFSHAASGVNTFDIGSEISILGSGTGTDAAVIARSGRVLYLGANGVRTLTLNSTKAIFLNSINAANLATTRPATVGEFYQDTAANILANGDKVVGIRQ